MIDLDLPTIDPDDLELAFKIEWLTQFVSVMDSIESFLVRPDCPAELRRLKWPSRRRVIQTLNLCEAKLKGIPVPPTINGHDNEVEVEWDALHAAYEQFTQLYAAWRTSRAVT